jgi:hypothetical protein
MAKVAQSRQSLNDIIFNLNQLECQSRVKLLESVTGANLSRRRQSDGNVKSTRLMTNFSLEFGRKFVGFGWELDRKLEEMIHCSVELIVWLNWCSP